MVFQLPQNMIMVYGDLNLGIMVVMRELQRRHSVEVLVMKLYH